MRPLKLILLLHLITVVAACVMTQLPPTERMRRSKCGACHIAPAAASLPHKELETAMTKHSKRVPLTAEEKAELVDYLAIKPPPDGEVKPSGVQ